MSDADKQCCPSAKGNLYLHRSELHAQRELDPHDAKAKREAASLRAKKRKEGFACSAQKGISFRPLGALRERKELDEMDKTENRRVQINVDKVVKEMQSQQETKEKKPGHAIRHADRGNKEGGDQDNDTEDMEDDHRRDQAGQKQNRNDFVLDLRAGRRGGIDGFDLLRQGIHESENRLQIVKTDGGASDGLDGASELERLMPPRHLYPAQSEKRAQRMASKCFNPAGERFSMSARGGGAQNVASLAQSASPGSRSARGPAPAASLSQSVADTTRRSPQNERHKSPRGTAISVQLPSLSESLAATGGAVVAGERGGPARGERTQVQQAANELLGLQANASLKLEEFAGGKKKNIIRRLDQELGIRREKLLAQIPHQIQMGDDPKAAMVVKESEVSHGAGAGDEASRRKPTEGDEQLEDMENLGKVGTKLKEILDTEEIGKLGKLGKKLKDILEKLERTDRELLKRRARLRSTLTGYQETRVRYRSDLESKLVSLEADRIETLKRRACQPDSGDSKERLKQQQQWYRTLLSHAQNDKRLLSSHVAHFIFDFIKSVLEHGKVFSSDMYFAMLGEIGNSEFSAGISTLVVNMLSEIDYVDTDDVMDWFDRHRGVVPIRVEEVILQRRTKHHNEDDDVVAPGMAADDSEQPAVVEGGRGVTFVTEDAA